MRSLATELGIEAASLYKHVRSKEDLEGGIAELVWEEIARAAPPNRDWAVWLHAYAHAIRDVIHDHPGTLVLWATQPIAPVPALELWDGQLQHCRPSTRDKGAEVLRVIGAFAIGYASTELSWYATPSTHPSESDTQRISRIARALPANASDRLIDVALLVCTGDATHTFEIGLNLMIKGLALPAT